MPTRPTDSVLAARAIDSLVTAMNELTMAAELPPETRRTVVELLQVARIQAGRIERRHAPNERST